MARHVICKLCGRKQRLMLTRSGVQLMVCIPPAVFSDTMNGRVCPVKEEASRRLRARGFKATSPFDRDLAFMVQCDVIVREREPWRDAWHRVPPENEIGAD